MSNIDFKKRIDEIKEKIIDEDKAEIMSSPLAEVASTVLYVHEENEEFLETVRRRAVKDLGTEMASDLMDNFKNDLGTKYDTIISATYMAHAVDFLKEIVEFGIVEDDKTIVYNNIITFFNDLINKKERR